MPYASRHAFKFEQAETVYSDLIELYGSPLLLSDREKSLLAKAYSNRGNARFNLNRLNEVCCVCGRGGEGLDGWMVLVRD